MSVSVIIPALNEATNIERAVASARQAGAGEVIVCDGGSSDATVATAARCGAATLVSDTLGRAAQMNLGAGKATGAVLLFLHADNWLAPDAIRQLETCLEQEKFLWGAFRQRIDAQGSIFRWIERGNAWRLRWQRLAYGDQAIFVRRHVFEELGGFAPVPLMEDVLLSRALARRAPPAHLPGPVHVDPRRWQRHGVIRQTLHNWRLMALWRLGVSPEKLSAAYRRHDC